MGSLYTDCKPVGSYPPTGIDVLIVGTGLAGLTAAIECVRKGHSVRVLERHDHINTMGDVYFMGQSATKFFRHWPLLQQEYNEISMQNAWYETFKHSGESMVPAIKASERLRAAGMDPNTTPGSFQMRPLVYQMYLNELNRQRIQVQFGQRVVDYFEDNSLQKGAVITDKGDRFEADIVIAADGIGSKAQRLLGGQIRAISSGRAMWRAAFPTHHLDKSPMVKKVFRLAGDNNNEPIVRTWLGPATYALTLVRPDTCVWLLNHDATGSEEENWSNTIESDEVLNNMDRGIGPIPWAPVFKQLVSITPPDTIVNFELLWRNPQPTWVSEGGRVLAIGDAAHSFLPASGNGATQAIEDAVSIATCLQMSGKANVPMAVRTHVRLRFVRCSCAQKMGFYNLEILQRTDWKKVETNPRLAQPKIPSWIWKHDPESYAYENYEAMADTIRKGIPFDEVTNVPPNYPPGYKYEPWDIETMLKEMEAGSVTLGSGNWE
ncbi:FAD/NAD(P)-binding domain-containing protein [Xylariaceae sp. FL1019]|nr:FAD/NAD(P)-binding domain-containing protein [Xylariaceae sp. FL1019]